MATDISSNYTQLSTNWVNVQYPWLIFCYDNRLKARYKPGLMGCYQVLVICGEISQAVGVLIRRSLLQLIGYISCGDWGGSWRARNVGLLLYIILSSYRISRVVSYRIASYCVISYIISYNCIYIYTRYFKYKKKNHNIVYLKPPPIQYSNKNRILNNFTGWVRPCAPSKCALECDTTPHHTNTTHARTAP